MNMARWLTFPSRDCTCKKAEEIRAEMGTMLTMMLRNTFTTERQRAHTSHTSNLTQRRAAAFASRPCLKYDSPLRSSRDFGTVRAHVPPETHPQRGHADKWIMPVPQRGARECVVTQDLYLGSSNSAERRQQTALSDLPQAPVTADTPVPRGGSPPHPLRTVFAAHRGAIKKKYHCNSRKAWKKIKRKTQLSRARTKATET